jgi:hypothetical protein
MASALVPLMSDLKPLSQKKPHGAPVRGGGPSSRQAIRTPSVLSKIPSRVAFGIFVVPRLFSSLDLEKAFAMYRSLASS